MCIYTGLFYCFFFFFSSRRRHTRWNCDWSSDVCSSDLPVQTGEDQLSGMWSPKEVSCAFKYPPKPTATATLLTAYSRIRSQPMIHAINSPSVAYEYV